MSTSSIQTGFSTQLTTLGTIFQDNIFAILGVAVLLIGAGWVWSRFKKHIHRRKI